MADPFQPKFVDLVRNYSTTVGTGNFVLGPAVNGFTSFTAALQVGDSFYYAAIGVDKPVEREVGRGTLLSNGAISRTPISGTKTNFTTGNKAISLIAAAEWFATVGAFAANASPLGKSIASAAAPSDVRALLALGSASLLDSDADPALTGDSDAKVPTQKAVKAYVDARPAGGGGLQPGNNLSDVGDVSAARANLGLASPANVKWFGAKGDSDINGSAGTDDTAAIRAALNFVDSIGGGTLYFPEGIYKVASYLTVPKNLRIVGAGRACTWIVTTATAGSGGATLEAQTRNDSVLYSNWPSNGSTAANVSIEHIGLRAANIGNVGAGFYDNCGTYLNLTDVDFSQFKYGAILDQSECVHVDYCDFEGFGSAGVWIVNGSDLKSGNASTFTNQLTINRCQFNSGVAAIGIMDDGGYTHAFNDNNYNGCLIHIRIAGLSGGRIWGGEFESAASYNILLTTATVAGTNVGQSDAITIGGEAMIAPTAGNPCIAIAACGTMTLDGIFLGNTSSAKITGTGNVNSIYARGLQNAGGGATFDGLPSNYHLLGNDGAGLFIKTNLIQKSDQTLDSGCKLIFNDPGGAASQSYAEHVSASPYLYHSVVSKGGTGGWQGAYRIQLNYNAGTLFDAFILKANTDGTTAALSVSGTIVASGAVSGSNIGTNGLPASIASGTIIGRTAAGNGAASALTSLPAAVMPALTGDVAMAAGTTTTTLSSATVVTKVAGQALAPSSISATGAVTSSGGGFGYATGAGGTVTQTTSKSTGVTLNKLCGQITMSAAALAASTNVSFTLTNSQVAAGDLLVLNHVSGGTLGAYHLNAHGMAAGTAVIDVRNLTAASLSEAIAIGFAVVKAVSA